MDVISEILSPQIMSFRDFFHKKRGTRQQRGFTGLTRLHQNLVPDMHKVNPNDIRKVEDLRDKKEGDGSKVLTPQDLAFVTQKYNIRNVTQNSPRNLGKTKIKLSFNPNIGNWILTKKSEA